MFTTRSSKAWPPAKGATIAWRLKSSPAEGWLKRAKKSPVPRVRMKMPTIDSKVTSRLAHQPIGVIRP